MKKIGLIFIILSLLSFSVVGQVRIKMKKINGVYVTPCKVNGLRLMFVFDTGASNVSISLSEALFMLKNGYLEESDLHGSSYSQIANGDIVKNTKVTIKEIVIGGIIIRDIDAIIIHELSAPLLLGQSAINKLGRIQLDGEYLLILDNKEGSIKEDSLIAVEMLNKAKKNFFNHLHKLASSQFQKAYDYNSRIFSCIDLYYMGSSYLFSDNPQKAIKFLSEALINKKITCNNFKDEIFETLSLAYFNLDDAQNSILFAEKSISITDEKMMECKMYKQIAMVYRFTENKRLKAVDYYQTSVDIYCEIKGMIILDMVRKEIKDDFLSKIILDIAVTYHEIGDESMLDFHLKVAALLGNSRAIELCRLGNLDYKNY